MSREDFIRHLQSRIPELRAHGDYTVASDLDTGVKILTGRSRMPKVKRDNFITFLRMSAKWPSRSDTADDLKSCAQYLEQHGAKRR